jgi:type IV secretory pathway protease TraF
VIVRTCHLIAAQRIRQSNPADTKPSWLLLTAAQIAEFCPTEPYSSLSAERGYRNERRCPEGGAPLTKLVGAQPRDTVEISTRGFVVNGKAFPNSAPLSIDTDGRSVKHWQFGRYRVEAESFWVIFYKTLAVSIRATSGL